MFSNKTFNGWLANVDAAIEKKTGMISADLPDCDYYTEWLNGTTPAKMARIAIREAGGY